MVCTAQGRVSIQQVVSTHPTLSTVLTLRDELQLPILTRAVLQSRAVGHLDNHTTSTSIIAILVHTVKGLVHMTRALQQVLQSLTGLRGQLIENGWMECYMECSTQHNSVRFLCWFYTSLSQTFYTMHPFNILTRWHPPYTHTDILTCAKTKGHKNH